MTARRSLLLRFFCAASCLGFAATLHAEDAKPNVTTVTLSEGGPLEIKAPDGWTVKVPKTPLGTTIVAAPKAGDADLKITFIPMQEELDKEKMEALLIIGAQQYIDGSVEKKMKLQNLDSKNATGMFAEFTDASLAGKRARPGQFAAVATGLIKIGKATGTFTLLGKSFDDKNYIAGKEILKSGLAEKK
jgi:hypothetical protein